MYISHRKLVQNTRARQEVAAWGRGERQVPSPLADQQLPERDRLGRFHGERLPNEIRLYRCRYDYMELYQPTLSTYFINLLYQPTS